LLGEASTSLRVGVEDLLLAALAGAFATLDAEADLFESLEKQSFLQVDLEGHGREALFEDVDLTRTVGWFTSVYPIRLEISSGLRVSERLRQVKREVLQAPRNGLSFGLLTYLSEGDAAEGMRDLPQAEVSFNYLGQLDRAMGGDALLRPLLELAGPATAPVNHKPYVLEVDASVVGGRLRVAFNHGSRLNSATVARLAQEFEATLEALLAAARTPSVQPCLVPEDFPLASLEVEELTGLLGHLAPREVSDIYPLAPVQEGMLFETLFAPESGAYVEQLSCRLQGALDVPKFARAWEETLARHSVLRTSFAWDDLNRPLQILHQRTGLSLTRLDWRELGRDEKEGRTEEFLLRDRRCAFDLSQASLTRLALLRQEDTLTVLVFTFHHLILDGWSVAAILKEVFDRYETLLAGRELVLPPAQSFREYIVWLEEKDLELSEEFWRRHLAGFTAPTSLGVDLRSLSKGEDGDRGSLPHWLSSEVTSALNALGRRQGLTLNTLVQGAWSLLLSRYSGETDVVTGATVSGRQGELPGLDSMVGVFINSLPLRLKIDPLSSVIPWLAEVQERQLEIREFEHSPLTKVQSWSELPAGEALFSSLLVFENYPVDESLRKQEGSFRVDSVVFAERTEVPLVLVVTPGSRLGLRLGYDGSRFSYTTVARLRDHLSNFLTELAEAEGRRVGDLRHLSSRERHQILLEWNDPSVTGDDYSSRGCLHHLCEEWARRTPDAPAVLSDDGCLTHGQLNERADSLARRLRMSGAGPERRVAISMDRCPELVVGILGILKAGAAYVPLDPGSPGDRMATSLESTGARILLSQEALLGRFADYEGEVVCLGSGSSVESKKDSSPLPPSLVTEDNLAYVMHTSGSTGVPKGVMISHGGVVNRLLFARAAGHLRPQDRFVQKASIAFDVSVLEIFLPLSVGGATVLARPGGQQDPAYLADLMARYEVNQAIFPPSLLRLLLEEDLSPCRSLHSVASSAEALPVELQRSFFEHLEADLYNRYGPTEASIAAASWLCEREVRHSVVPIGRPIAKAQLYSLDPFGHPVAAEVSGELHIGGKCLGRGYFGRAGQTAEVFVPDPFSQEPGCRLYATGDRVRQRPDGAFEFLGRTDHQIKIRGFRVELGEIEAALSELEEVAQCVVVDREGVAGSKRLVAFLVPEDNRELDAETLRAALGQRLPDYMIPSAFVPLDALPVNASGKVDRKALPDATGQLAVTRDYEAPVTEVEKALAAIWAETLGLDTVGVHDDFFGLGGDSILRIRVLSKARRQGIHLELRQLFSHPTVAGLASVAGEAGVVEAQQGPVVGPVPLTPIQKRFFAQSWPNPHWVNQFLLLEVAPGFPWERLDGALTTLVEHHDCLRLRFDGESEGWRQEIVAPGEIVPNGTVSNGTAPVERVDVSGASDEEQRRWVEERAGQLQATLDLTKGPLLRAAYFDAGSKKSGRLFLTMHHLAVDGVSWRILLEDLEMLVKVPPSEDEVYLPAKTTSYQRWAHRLAEYADSDALLGEADYWKSLLKLELEPLPVDHAHGRARNTEDSVGETRIVLPQDETQKLILALPEVYRAQVSDALLAALGLSFQRWSGEARLLVDLEGHGREHPFDDVDVHRTVGWFTSVFPSVVDLDPGSPDHTAVKVVREQQRRVPYGGIGYGVLRYLSTESEAHEALSRLPSPEVLFNYHGQIDREAVASDLFKLSRDPAGSARSPAGPRRYLIEVNASVIEGELELIWTYSENVHRSETIEGLAKSLVEILRSFLEAANEPEAAEVSPEDFPEVQLSQLQLDTILKKVRKRS